MTAPQIYTHETGRESHSRAGTPHPAYVDWLEHICAKAAEIVWIVPPPSNKCSNEIGEELRNLFSEIV